MGSVSSSCFVLESWSPWPCCHFVEHHVVGRTWAGGGQQLCWGMVLPSKEALGQGWDWKAGWDWGSRVGRLFLYMGLGR